MRSMRPDKEINCISVRIPRKDGKIIPALVLLPKVRRRNAPGILWVHGGGYIAGMKEMVHMSRVVDLVKKYGAVVVSPGYRIALTAPYPVAVNDCYDTLLYLKKHANVFGINPNQIMVGGESAGGGLCAALCMMARDKGKVHIAYQMPLYPMLDNLDTESSADNHGRIWNTRRNHLAWKLYLRQDAKKWSHLMQHRHGRQITRDCRLRIRLSETVNRFIARPVLTLKICKKRVWKRSWMFTLPICTHLI